MSFSGPEKRSGKERRRGFDRRQVKSKNIPSNKRSGIPRRMYQRRKPGV